MALVFLNENWLPKSVLCLRGYDRHKFLLDLIAGVTVGLVALPLAMAFSIASGLTPQAGIYCAIVTGFLISALGGSKTQIGGPTGAFVVVVAGIVAVHGVDGLFMCTVMAGVLLVIMGVTGLGTAVKFIPRPVVIGFTNGIAVLIASTQVKDFFGLHLDKVPGVFWQRMEALAASFHTLSFMATALAIGTLATLLVCRALSPRIPGPIVALLLATAAVYFFKLPVETIGTKFGGIPAGLPHLQIPKFRFDLIHGLLGPAFTVAMLGAIESLMSAVVSDRMSGDRHNPNVELIGAGHRQLFLPDVRRAAGHGRHCAYGDQHPLRRAVAGRRHHSRADAALHLALRRATGQLCAHGRSRWDSHGRRLQHGRVAGDSATAQTDQDRHQRLAGHVRA